MGNRASRLTKIQHKDLQDQAQLNKLQPGDARAMQKQLHDALSGLCMIVADEVNTAIASIQSISENAKVSDQDKIDGLKIIYAMAAEALERAVAQPVRVAPALWEERAEWRTSPCDFVKATYPNYNKGLCMADIRHLDPPLYRSLINFRARYGWPSDFNLPRKDTRNSQLAEIFYPVATTAPGKGEELTPAQQALMKSVRHTMTHR